MRDSSYMNPDLIQRLRDSADGLKSCDECNGECRGTCIFTEAADAIEELLAFARSVARRAVDAQDDEVSAEVLCRKLYKLGIIEKDGAWWYYEPPKEVQDA